MPTRRPNILWICTDQQRWDTLGCYGNPFVQTPNIDALAAGGALFERCFSQSPVCTPSRASFLTGRYPRTTRCRQNGQDIPENEVLVTKLFADVGYHCGLSGKLHLSPCNPSHCKTTERRIDDGYNDADFHWSHHERAGWGTNNAYWAWLAEQGVDFEVSPHPQSDYVILGMPEEHHQTTWCIETAMDFVEERAADEQPWLFSINTFDPHHAFNPPANYLERYMERLDEIPLPNYEEGELVDRSPYQAFDHDGAYGHTTGFPYDQMSDFDHRLVRAAYWAMCDLIDVQVGRLLAKLEETGQLGNTLVIFMSDHGEMLGDHGVYLKGPYFYEEAVHVPLIVSWPGHIEPRRVSGMVELVDIAPTLMETAQLTPYPGMQGRSLWPLLCGEVYGEDFRDDIYCEYYNAMPWHREPTAQATMVRTAEHKLVVDHGNDMGELYDLVADPTERVNVWDDPAAQSVKTRMLMRLCHRMAWTVDPLPPRLADW